CAWPLHVARKLRGAHAVIDKRQCQSSLLDGGSDRRFQLDEFTLALCIPRSFSDRFPRGDLNAELLNRELFVTVREDLVQNPCAVEDANVEPVVLAQFVFYFRA